MRMHRSIPLALTLLLAACANEPPRAPDPVPGPDWTAATRKEAAALEGHLSSFPASDANALVIRLAFDGRADLDLYVSDPLQETVYYANTPARSGGRLLGDRHCKEEADSGIRIEEIVFDDPPAGSYRVGVDYPHRCGPGARIAAFAITIDAGGRRRELLGLAEPVVFTPIVAEIEVGP